MAVAARALPYSSQVDVDYHRILVPLTDGAEWRPAMTTACRLAAERAAAVTAISVIEVPVELPLDAHMIEEEAQARHLLSEAEAIGDAHDVTVVPLVVRARSAGHAIVEAAVSGSAEIIVLRAVRRRRPSKRGALFGGTTSFVLENAPCRVLVSASAPV